MKTERNILVAFLLNLAFSLFELFGGFFTNSVAIVSDAVHDFGDSISIGISYFLEKKSKRKPDNKYTYGYTRYSILGAFITNTILITGSVLVIVNAIERIINPIEINYNGMIIFAIFGTLINFLAAYFTKDGDSLNQKAVNLHMLEDVLGWIVVLIGAIAMKFTNINLIDSILSIGVAIFILIHALKSFKKILDLFLTKTPNDVNIEHLKEHLLKIDNVIDIHHIHIWSMDGFNNYATMHLVTKTEDIKKLKQEVREELEVHGINHVTIELEDGSYDCDEKECEVKTNHKHSHHHHHQ
ncbi:MAG: cation transporter [Clostridia bacterium]|nr:cation transporter [Clostridia bacterium]